MAKFSTIPGEKAPLFRRKFFANKRYTVYLYRSSTRLARAQRDDVTPAGWHALPRRVSSEAISFRGYYHGGGGGRSDEDPMAII